MSELDALWEKATPVRIEDDMESLWEQATPVGQAAPKPPVMSAEETDALGEYGMIGAEAQPVQAPTYGPMEVVRDVPRMAAHGIASIPDIPGNLVGLGQRADAAMLKWVQEHGPEWAQGPAEAAFTIPNPLAKVVPPPGHFEHAMQEATGIEEPKTVPGKVGEVFFAAGAPGLVGKVTKVLTKLGRTPKEIKAIIKEIESSGNDPRVINALLGTDDLSKAPNFAQRFPKMEQYGLKTADEAEDLASGLYNDIPKMPGYRETVDVTSPITKDGLSYKQAVNELIDVTTEGLIPQTTLKKLAAAQDWTVRDVYMMARKLRRLRRMTKDREKQKLLGDYLKLLDQIPLYKKYGAPDAMMAIKEANKLYFEGMQAEDIANIAIDASQVGKAGRMTRATGQPTVTAEEMLKGFEGKGHKELRLRLGPNYEKVRQALQKMDQKEMMDDKKLSMLGRLLGGVMDWRVVSWLTGGARLVGTPEYHSAKAVKSLLKKRR